MNEEQEMNLPLQISAFLRALNLKKPVLIISNSHSLCFWYYHLVNHGGCDVVQVTQKLDVLNKKYKQLALILDISELQLVEKVINIDFFCVIIENFDTIANKLIIKKLNGDFNIGLTQKNFYVSNINW